MNGVATTGPQDPAAKEAGTDDDGDRRDAGTASQASPDASIPPAGNATGEAVDVPRRRRGILLGTRSGDAPPAAADDEKSLAWMAAQAVKALNAVKASQMEQAQALKAGGEDSLGEEDTGLHDAEPVQSSPEEQFAAMRVLNAEEVSAEAASLAVQSGMAAMAPLPASPPPAQTATVGQPGATPLAQPVEPPGMPAVSRGTSASGMPARLMFMLGVLLLFGYAGYRYWFAADHAANDIPSVPSAVIEPGGPAAGVEMNAPAISVVAAPEPAARAAASAPVEPEAASTPEPAPGTSPAGIPKAGKSETAAVETQKPANTVESPPLAPASPEPVAEPPAWQPAVVPVVPAPVVDADAAAIRPAPVPESPPLSPENPEPGAVPQAWQPAAAPVAPAPAVEADAAATRPAPAPPSAPATRSEAPARPAAPPAPATQQRYPANGYGYYPPPASWQPYYRPGYPQAPSRQQ